MSHNEPLPADRQYQALRDDGGVVQLAGWSNVTLTGADRQTFLHNFCTNDVKRLEPGTSCEAFVTNVKGRIVGHGLITCREHELVLIGAPGQGPQLVEHLDRYVIREDVQLRDTTDKRAYLLIAGNEAARRRLAERGIGLTDGADNDGRLAHLAGSLEGVLLRSISWTLVAGEFQCLLEVAPQDRWRLLEALPELGFVVCDERAFTTARIEAGMPLYGIDFDDHNFPQEVRRDREAISFTKGCYLGQETVARIDALGHVNQRLVGVRFLGDTVPPVGTELFVAGANLGRVTSATFSPRLGAPLAIALVRREANVPGSRLESPAGPAEVVAPPVDRVVSS